MTVTSSNPEILSELDRPNSYIGRWCRGRISSG